MTTMENERLRELYRELNQDHERRRAELLSQLPSTPAMSNDGDRSERPVHRRVSRYWWLGTAAAVAILIFAGVFLLKPHDAWAESVNAVRSQKWIHFVRRDSDGMVSEVWESPLAEISAFKSAAEIRWLDKSTSLMQIFYVDQNKVVRLELKDQVQTDSMQLFIELLLGKVERLEHLLVIDRQQRSVTENDHVLDEVRLTVQPTGGTRMLWTARIDRVTHLPLTLRVELADASGLAEPLVEGRFDYPANGPESLSAMGLPEDVSFEDRVPKNSLKNILAEMKTQRRTLGAYHLSVVDASHGRIWYEAWKDGLMWRQDYQQPDVCDGNQWWSKHLGYWQLMKKIPDGPAGEFCRLNQQWYYLENLTYPLLSATPEFDLVVHPDRTDGPEGCVLVERVAVAGADPKIVHRFTPRLEQYWLDPRRNFAVVKRIFTGVEAPESECHAKGIAKHVETTFEDFLQSPDGVWYPTTVRTTGTVWIKQMNPIIVQPLDQHWKLTVDFRDSFPGETFDIHAARERSP